MLGKCAKQYEFAYLQKMRRPPGVAAVIGKGPHKSIQEDLTAKKATGFLLTEEQIRDIAGDAFNANWDGEEPLLTPEEKERGVKAVKGDGKDVAIALAVLHHNELAPKITPVNVERAFRVVLQGFPYDLLGYWDIEEPFGIRDTKTIGKTPGEEVADRDAQLILYAFSKKVIDGRAPDFVARDHLVKSKREPKIFTALAYPTDEDFKTLLERVSIAARVIQSGIFMPTNSDNWWCSERWCGFFEICPFGQRRSVSVAVSNNDNGSET